MAVDLSEYAEPEQSSAGPDLSEYAVPQQRGGVQEFDVSDMALQNPNVRQPGYGPKDIAESVSNAVTGNDRREFDLPELGLPFEFKKRQVKTAAGLMSTFNPEQEMAVLRNNYPEMKFAQDKFGNIIADSTMYGGNIGYVNDPGISPRDVIKAGFQIVAFTPAARAGNLATTVPSRMGAVGMASGATEAGLDTLSRYTAGQPIGPANMDVGNVTIAAVGGGVFEGIGHMLGKAFLPAWQAARGEITPEIRSVFQQEAMKAGIDPKDVSDNVIRFYMEAADNAVNPQAMPALRDTQEFGIDYTLGQRTGDKSQLRVEERLKTGPAPAAAHTMEGFSDRQGSQIMSARERLQGQVAGEHPQIQSVAEGGEAAIEGTRRRSAQALGEVDEAYESVGQASLLPEGQRGLVTRLERVAKTGNYTRTTETPATNAILDEVVKLRAFIDERGNLLRAQPLRSIERLRKQVNAHIGTAKNKTDMRQARELKEEFDLYLDRAITRTLFSGDQSALAQLKKARGLHRDYMKKFAPQYRRGRSGARIRVGAGDVIERIIEADPTAENVINFMFGMSKLGGKERGAQVLKQFRDVLGEESAEWSALRQAAFLKLTDPGKESVLSGAKFLTNLTDAQNNAGTMLKLLFTPEEVKTLTRFARAVSRAQPKPFNPSGTAASAAGFVSDMWKGIVTMFGGAQAGPMGAVAANKSFTTMTGFREWMKAQAATTASQVPLRRMNAAAVGAPASVGAFGD